MTRGKKSRKSGLIPVCLAYIRELVVLSNGNVTTCCLDAKGTNRLGSIEEISLETLWAERSLPWHKGNVKANLKGRKWKSKLCRECLKENLMVAFNAKRTKDAVMIETFHQLSHPFPASLVIEPTSACNYLCRGCITGLKGLGSDNDFLSIDTFKKSILPVIPNVKQVRLYNYGEPFMHPEIITMIRLLRSKNPTLSLHVSTNSMLMSRNIAKALVESQVNYLTISLHGGHKQEGLLKYARRGADINVIRSNIEFLVDQKRKKGSKLPWIFLKAILFHWNDAEEEMAAFQKFGEEIGADFSGWGDNASDPALSSKRFVPGTQAYRSLSDRKLLERNFYELPAWPSDVQPTSK
jgi:MoaA/NifB/PqqE/SkfB family radical SAM enzyme